MKCPVCGAAQLTHDTRDIEHAHKGQTTVIRGVVGEFCSSCDEVIMDLAESERVMREMQAFNRQVDALGGDPVFIAGVRKKLNLGQREAAALFGGGVNAFSRYENGRARPPRALIKLLKVLDRHPELLREVRDAA